MALTVNQILMICLILVLIGFVIEVAIMAVPTLELVKKLKVLADDGQNTLDKSNELIDDMGNRIISAVSSVAADTTTATKAIAGAGVGLTALNLTRMVGKSLVGGSGVLAVMAERRSRKKARKELKKSKKMIRKVNKQTKLESKAIRKSKKVAAKNRKFEKKAAKRAAREARRNK